jgi:hypothetical protein
MTSPVSHPFPSTAGQRGAASPADAEAVAPLSDRDESPVTNSSLTSGWAEPEV